MYGKALIIKPMKVWQLPKNKKHMKDEVCNSGNYFGQLKKDGYWYMFEKDIEGNCFLFSRVESVQTGYLSEKSANVPHIIKALDSKLPNGTIIIGEIYYPNKTSKDVTCIMGCDPEKAITRQNAEYGLIHYYMHDILSYNGQLYLDRNNIDRYIELENITDGYNLLEDDFIELAEAFTDNLSARIDQAFEDGEEGMVLKKFNGKYYSGKKPAWEMIKFKIEDEHDVVCMGYTSPKEAYEGEELETWQYWEDYEGDKYDFKPSFWNEDEFRPITKSYYKDWIGAIRVGVYKDGELVEVGRVSSGLTDSLCEEIKEDPEKFIGQPMLVKCMMAYDGALRHPALIRFRDDINATDCTWDKIFD